MLFPMAHNGDCLRQTAGGALPQIGDPEVKIVHSGILSVIEIFHQLRCRLRVNGRRYSRSSNSSSGAFRSRILYPLTMRFSDIELATASGASRPALLTPSNRLKFEFLSLRHFSGDPQLTSVY